MKCEVCDDEGTYPIISSMGSHLYDIKCPHCLGISDEEIERKCAEDRAALDLWNTKVRAHRETAQSAVQPTESAE